MNQQVKPFLDAVCEQVRCREVHEEIRLELGGHLEELVEMHVAAGLSEADAVSRALADMGDPLLIGQQLNQTHRPRTEWGLLAAALCLAMLGIWAMYAVDASGSGMNFFGVKLTWSAVGLALGAGLFFLDYRRLHPYSGVLYGATLAGTVLLVLYGPWVNGQPLGIGHTPILFALALAGLFATWDWRSPWALTKAVALFAAPALVYLKFSGMGAELLQFGASFTVLLVLSKPRRGQAEALAVLGLIGAGWALLRIWGTAYLRERLLYALNPFQDPMGAGYQAVQARLALQGAGWWGQGATAGLERLPEVHSDFIFPYLVYTLGWAAGAAIFLLVAFFLGRMLLALRKVRDLYGSYLITGILTLFIFRFGWNLLMAVGLLPIAGVDLPFVSHGMQGALQLALVGLVLGIFRRKDMGRSPLKTA
ncbi:MAG TPA: FtsW/RodA/SpoVE family cell cycle protein [Symbiobacteriaceae bacterium]|nr:FtsW/RodA/SpoVE family cell cycle protein [Symbiobacteriaceae bacterium]